MKLLAALVFVAAATATATAEEAPAARDAATDAASADCKRFRKQGQPCVLSFAEGEQIEGGVEGAGGFDFTGREISTFSSLIRVRTDFRAEIIRAADEI